MKRLLVFLILSGCAPITPSVTSTSCIDYVPIVEDVRFLQSWQEAGLSVNEDNVIVTRECMITIPSGVYALTTKPEGRSLEQRADGSFYIAGE